MATYQISPPEKFNFHQPDDWSKWIHRFERFRQASGLASKSEESQVNSLVYCMGDEADDILSSFGLTNEDSKKYTTVKERFEGHFIKKRNVIFERAKFNQRVQKDGEAVDTFVTALYQLAEHCRYGDLRDEMIRDRIVVGLRDTNLSVKLQMEETLTLEKAVAMSRQSESVKKQQTVVRAQPVESVDAVRAKVGFRNRPGAASGQGTRKPESYEKGGGRPRTPQRACMRCGKWPLHPQHLCPPLASTAKELGTSNGVAKPLSQWENRLRL